MSLTAADPHHWHPQHDVRAWLRTQVPADARILDIGPGHHPLTWATHYVDFVDIEGLGAKPLWKVDLATQPLPFPDKSFDFIYARHCIEDMYNPFPLLKEMERVGKAGYIETPSPIAELCRGVDGAVPKWRGYHHHHFICWARERELSLISKYPIVEHAGIDDMTLATFLRSSPYYWNTYYLWRDKISVDHIQSPMHYDIVRDYEVRLRIACEQAKISSEAFYANVVTKQAA